MDVVTEYGMTDLGWGPTAGPWRYRKMAEPEVTHELERLSFAKEHAFDGVDSGNKQKIYSVSLQPSPNPEQASQDRLVAEKWALQDGVWTFTAIFDGHAGHETADFVQEHLPSRVRQRLENALNDGDPGQAPDLVTNALQDAIKSVDETFVQDLNALFPGAPESLCDLSDEHIQRVANDGEQGGVNAMKIRRCMSGSTVLVSLVDPQYENLWVASLGDCVAVLGSARAAVGRADRDDENAMQNIMFEATVLSSNHNGRDEGEQARVRKEHPGEENVILRNRVLGAIAVTRAVGDQLFKLPAIYTQRVFFNTTAGFRVSIKVEEYIGRNLTPPYLSNMADVKHINLTRMALQGEDVHKFLILCSDGLLDLSMAHDSIQKSAEHWTEVIGRAVVSAAAQARAQASPNLALRLLRDSLGGDDVQRLSEMLTVELEERWMDDTTIIVQQL